MMLQHAINSGLQVAHLTEQHQRTQTYNAQLQEYNGQLQGEVQTNAQATSRLQVRQDQCAAISHCTALSL